MEKRARPQAQRRRGHGLKQTLHAARAGSLPLARLRPHVQHLPIPSPPLSPRCRAFLKNPRVLLFDEATSALDTGTEREILESLAALAAGRTSIFVAHRLSTAAACDQVRALP